MTVKEQMFAAMCAATLMAAPAFAQDGAGTGSPSSSVPAQAAVPAAQPLTVKDWMNRPQLFGDWGGARTKAADKGFQLGASWTQFFDSAPIASASGDTRELSYGGKADLRISTDFSRMFTGWNGLSAAAHVAFRHGKAPLATAGTFLPVTTALLFPDREGLAVDIDSLYITKMFGDTMMIQAGRFSMLDNYARPFTGGEGIDMFQNAAFVLPPLLARTTPAIAEGVFFSTLKDGDPRVTVGLYESTREGFFKNGSTVYGALNLPIRIWAAPGHYTVSGTISSTKATVLESSDDAFVPQPVLQPALASVTGAWTVDVKFDQYLLWDPTTKTGYGVFGMIGLSEANPSVVDIFAHVGIGGASPMPNRPHDTFGAGYYRAGVSKTLVDAVAPALRLRREQGIEAYYNVAVTGWSMVQGDVQFVSPFTTGAAQRLFFSVRWKLNF